jgi:hypothetical protein
MTGAGQDPTPIHLCIDPLKGNTLPCVQMNHKIDFRVSILGAWVEGSALKVVDQSGLCDV